MQSPWFGGIIMIVMVVGLGVWIWWMMRKNKGKLESRDRWDTPKGLYFRYRKPYRFCPGGNHNERSQDLSSPLFQMQRGNDTCTGAFPVRAGRNPHLENIHLLYQRGPGVSSPPSV